MRFLKLRAVALIATIALVGAACDDDETGLTKEDWIKAAAAICQEQTDAFNQLFETGFPTTPEKTLEFFGNATPILEERLDRLQELEVPEEDADDIEAVLETGEAAIEDFQAVDTTDEATELFSAEGGENHSAFEDGMKEQGVPECAEDEDEESVERLDPSTFSAEKRAFVEQADALCTTANEAIRPAEEQYLDPFPPPLENWVGFLDAVIPALEEQAAGLRALEPPAEDAAQIDELLSGVDAQLARLKEMRDAAAAGNQEEFDKISQETFSGFDEIDQASVEYGFQVCGPEEDDEEDENGGGENGDTEEEEEQ